MSFNKQFGVNLEHFAQRTKDMAIDCAPELKLSHCLANA